MVMVKYARLVGIVVAGLVAVCHAQGLAPAGQSAGGQGAPRTASQPPPPSVTPQSYPPEQVQAGRQLFGSQCAFCHGRDAAGGETGPDLTRSKLTAEDNRGDAIGPLVRSGRLDKGMPGFNLAETDLAAIVAFIHEQKTRAESQEGSRRAVDVLDLQTGSAEAGRRYFNGVGRCATCHTPDGDLAGVATRLKGLTLLQRMLNPASAGTGGRPVAAATVVVTLPSGERATGTLAYRDEFTIALRDASGWYRSWPADTVKVAVDDRLDAHVQLLGRYTEAEMHDVLAYLQTLR
jgi:cytochrome c oxidase cbb3-type subunit III